MTGDGHIFQVNSSDGGVPKLPQPSGSVDLFGLATDKQHDVHHHGGTERALCLYSLERILSLQQEGHPIYPGAIGENVTLAGLDWAQIREGTQLQLGPEVRIEITSFASPCMNIRSAFREGTIELVSEKAHAGWARAYARVLQTGTIRPGDPVTLIT